MTYPVSPQGRAINSNHKTLNIMTLSIHITIWKWDFYVSLNSTVNRK